MNADFQDINEKQKLKRKESFYFNLRLSAKICIPFDQKRSEK